MFSVIILFVILGLLFAVESSTSISRKSGYVIKNPASGFIFQSSLSLVSRALIFMFMPMLGYLSDKDNLTNDYKSILFMYLFIPFFLFLVYLFRYKLEGLYGVLLLRISESGNYFKKAKDSYSVSVIPGNQFKRFKKLYLIVFVAYVPYYISWSLIIILLDKYNESRGLILGLSSVFNGINTIIITTIVDPKLAQLGKYNNLITRVYNDLILVRVFIGLISFLALGIIILIIS
ncbi:hypothetical protein [Polaribacter ponticola]|uniref:DUF2837 family protein n=1 Tax=Polaribacter ponticola TaxID=2978475 RepID=A0ABT5S5K7_9FLAO|nr:hypothetical protein [Polaribacter sp. MSW5]MDD7913391.1 hypothetical protein [Polaribacter sp. MSW5]